jgi:type III pantothenate kinase
VSAPPILAIDAGNSGLKLALVAGGVVQARARVPTEPGPSSGALAEAVGALTAPGDAPTPELAAIVSVVPAWTPLVREAASRAGLELVVADERTIPLPVDLPHPGHVGADRLLAAWGAARAGSPVIVVDLGTATTVDVVGPAGGFLGGAILPGLTLGIRALARGTAQLPEVPVALPELAIGRDTVEAIRSGVVLGHLGAVRELVARMRDELGTAGTAAPVVATGTITAEPWARAALVSPGPGATRAIADRVEPDLVLLALAELARRNARVVA